MKGNMMDGGSWPLLTFPLEWKVLCPGGQHFTSRVELVVILKPHGPETRRMGDSSLPLRRHPQALSLPPSSNGHIIKHLAVQIIAP